MLSVLLAAIVLAPPEHGRSRDQEPAPGEKSLVLATLLDALQDPAKSRTNGYVIRNNEGRYEVICLARHLAKDASLASLGALKSIGRLAILGAGAADCPTAKGISSLNELEHLRTLSLRCWGTIPPDLFQGIGSLTNMHVLNIEYGDIPNGAFSSLSNACALERIEIVMCRNWGDGQLAELKSLQNLRSIAIKHTAVTVAGIARLSEMRALTNATIENASFNTNWVRH